MTDSTLFVGKRGHGKTLSAVRLIASYMREGRTVATNVNIFPEYLCPSWNKVVTYRLPDWPRAADLEALPLGNPDPVNEEKNGLLVLDEVATFLNSRNWQERDRQDLIAFFAQSRKRGWDLVFLAQHQRMLDAQIRDSLCDLLAVCKRADKISIPFLSPVWKWLTGKPFKFPKYHAVNFYYGFLPNAPRIDRWFYGGAEFHKGYDTLQKISPLVGQVGLSCNLDAWRLKGRHMSKFQLYKGVGIAGFLLGLIVGGVSGYVFFLFNGSDKEESFAVESVDLVKPERVVVGVIGGLRGVIFFSDGSKVEFNHIKKEQDKILYYTKEYGIIEGPKND